MAPEDNRKWLVMLYLAGDNNLTEEMVLAMQDLMAEGPPDGDKIVAQFDPSGVGLSTQRYDFSVPKGPPLENYTREDFPSSVNMGSQGVLVDFIKWAHNLKPEEDSSGDIYGKDRNHLLILCGHGSGVTESFLMADDSSMDSLTIDELKGGLARAKDAIDKKIDILGLDACYMSMGEVAYEIRDSVGIMIGAEGLEPAFGWPYRQILARAKKQRVSSDTNSGMLPEDLAKAIVEEYIWHYADYDRTAGRSVDLAAVNLGQINTLIQPFTALVSALDHADQDKLLLAHWYAQTYKYEQFVDLKDLCVQVKAKFVKGPEYDACQPVIDAVEACVIKSGCSGFAYQFSYGLSIYFPWAFVSPDYENLAFATETGWRAFLEAHVKETRRRPARYPPTQRKSLGELLAIAEQDRGEGSLSAVEKSIVEQMKRILRLPTLNFDLAQESSARKHESPKDRLRRAVSRLEASDVPPEDISAALSWRTVRAGALYDPGNRYTGIGSRYTGIGSKYTGIGSKYTGVGSRSPFDREKTVKNLEPVVGHLPPLPTQQR